MNRIPAWLTYTLLRLLFVAVPFGILLAVGMDWLYAIVIATLLSFALSLLLLRKPREAAAIALYEARQRGKSASQAAEEANEDAHADQVHAETSQPTGQPERD